MSSEPSDGSTKVVSVESEEMSTFDCIHLGEDFGLSAVLRFVPVEIPV